MAIGFFLNMDAESDGIGFVNPHPLPAFPHGMTKLHLLGRKAYPSSINRLTLEPGDLTFSGGTFRDQDIWFASEGQQWRDTNPAEYVGGEWTYVVAMDLSQAPLPSNAIISSDWSGSGMRGMRFTVTSSGTYDVSLQLRAHSAGGLASVDRAINLPSGYVTVFLRFDGTSASIIVPSHSPSSSSSDVAGGPGNLPTPDATLGGPSLGQIAYAVYAAWDRALSNAEVTNAHAALKEWANALGVNIV